MVFHPSKDCPLYNGFPSSRTRFSTLPNVLYCQSTVIHTLSYFIHPSFSLSSLPSCSFCFSFYDSLLRICSLSFSLGVQTIVTVFLQLPVAQLVQWCHVYSPPSFISIPAFRSTPSHLPILYFPLRTLKTRQILRTVHRAINIQTTTGKASHQQILTELLRGFPRFLQMSIRNLTILSAFVPYLRLSLLIL